MAIAMENLISFSLWFILGPILALIIHDAYKWIKDKWQLREARKQAERERIKEEWEDKTRAFFLMDTPERIKYLEWENREIEKRTREMRKKIILGSFALLFILIF